MKNIKKDNGWIFYLFYDFVDLAIEYINIEESYKIISNLFNDLFNDEDDKEFNELKILVIISNIIINY